MSKRLSRILAAMTCAASLSVYAANDGEQRRGGDQPRAPLQAAVDACKGAVESATCQFTGRDNEAVAGTCKTARNSEEKSPLVCRPDRKDWKPKDGAEQGSTEKDDVKKASAEQDHAAHGHAHH